MLQYIRRGSAYSTEFLEDGVELTPKQDACLKSLTKSISNSATCIKIRYILFRTRLSVSANHTSGQLSGKKPQSLLSLMRSLILALTKMDWLVWKGYPLMHRQALLKDTKIEPAIIQTVRWQIISIETWRTWRTANFTGTAYQFLRLGGRIRTPKLIKKPNTRIIQIVLKQKEHLVWPGDAMDLAG